VPHDPRYPMSLADQRVRPGVRRAVPPKAGGLALTPASGAAGAALDLTTAQLGNGSAHPRQRITRGPPALHSAGSVEELEKLVGGQGRLSQDRRQRAALHYAVPRDDGHAPSRFRYTA